MGHREHHDQRLVRVVSDGTRPGNLVGYIPGLGPPRLDPDQEKRLRRALRRMVTSDELVPRAPAPQALW